MFLSFLVLELCDCRLLHAVAAFGVRQIGRADVVGHL